MEKERGHEPGWKREEVVESKEMGDAPELQLEKRDEQQLESVIGKAQFGQRVKLKSEPTSNLKMEKWQGESSGQRDEQRFGQTQEGRRECEWNGEHEHEREREQQWGGDAWLQVSVPSTLLKDTEISSIISAQNIPPRKVYPSNTIGKSHNAHVILEVDLCFAIFYNVMSHLLTFRSC